MLCVFVGEEAVEVNGNSEMSKTIHEQRITEMKSHLLVPTLHICIKPAPQHHTHSERQLSSIFSAQHSSYLYTHYTYACIHASPTSSHPPIDTKQHWTQWQKKTRKNWIQELYSTRCMQSMYYVLRILLKLMLIPTDWGRIATAEKWKRLLGLDDDECVAVCAE